jgi:hypothetical protein
MGFLVKFLDMGDRFSSTLLTGRRKAAFITVIFIVGSVCCGIYSISHGPFNDWDLRNYQYYSPYALLNWRYDFDYAPAQIQTFLNPVPFVPFYLLATHLKPVLAGFLMGSIHGLAAGLLFLAAMAVFSDLSPFTRIMLSLLCATLGVYGPTFLGYMGGSGADNITSLFILAGIYILVRQIRLHGAPDVREARIALMAGGVLIGIAAGLKLVCAVFLIGSVIAVLVAGHGFRTRVTATGLFGIAGVVGALISRGHWMMFLWSRFNSPLFPFLNKIFQSPYYYIRNFSDDRYIPRTLKTAILLPFQFITENTYTHLSRGFRDIRYPLVYGLILLCLAVLIAGLILRLLRRPLSKYRLPDRTELFLLVFFIVSYVIWQMKFAILRYAVPLELLAPILITVLIRLVVPWKTIRHVLIIAAFTAIALVMEPWVVMHRSWSSSYLTVEAPQLDDPDETLVIMANNMPWAYVIPAFQPEVRFIGLLSTYSNPDPAHHHRGAEEMSNIVKSHEGPMYVLSSNQRIDLVMKALSPLRIVMAGRDETGGTTRHLSIHEIYESDVILPVLTKQEQTRLFLWPVEISETKAERRGMQKQPVKRKQRIAPRERPPQRKKSLKKS